MLLAVQPPATVAHTANAQAEQWRDQAAQWAIQTERWQALWTWEALSFLLLVLALGVLLWQNAELKKQVVRLLNRS